MATCTACLPPPRFPITNRVALSAHGEHRGRQPHPRRPAPRLGQHPRWRRLLFRLLRLVCRPRLTCPPPHSHRLHEVIVSVTAGVRRPPASPLLCLRCCPRWLPHTPHPARRTPPPPTPQLVGDGPLLRLGLVGRLHHLRLHLIFLSLKCRRLRKVVHWSRLPPHPRNVTSVASHRCFSHSRRFMARLPVVVAPLALLRSVHRPLLPSQATTHTDRMATASRTPLTALKATSQVRV